MSGREATRGKMHVIKRSKFYNRFSANAKPVKICRLDLADLKFMLIRSLFVQNE